VTHPEAFDGLRRVEEILLSTCWMPSRHGMLEAYWKGFAKTLDLRARWQRQGDDGWVVEPWRWMPWNVWGLDVF